jgi:glycine/D-amino acid oxidase-like deaminating enzyme
LNSKAQDILIVGAGLAGSTLALELEQRGGSFVLLDNQFPNSSSRIAAGLLNPIVPKGVRKTWQCNQLFPAVYGYYQAWEALLNEQFIHNYPFLNIHANASETQEWRKRLNDPEMLGWLTADDRSSFPEIPREHATWVNHCGRLDVSRFLQCVQLHLEDLGIYEKGEFYHKACLRTEEGWMYQSRYYRAIVFCEGVGILNNPWFNDLFFDPTGGDILKVYIPNLGEHPCIIKQKQWIVPTGEKDIYLLGSNFHKNTLSCQPDQADANKLLKRAEEITQQKVTLLEHRRGVRPTVQQRRPYLGEHPTEKGLFVFNGLGAKGSSLCSWLSPIMADHILQRSPLPNQVDIQRQPM